MNRIALVSLGCPKNLVDSEYICQRLLAAGYPLESDPGKADTIVVNTCAFLTESVEESIQTLLGYLQEGKEVVCTGCLVSRYGRELLDELPEVRLFAGPGTYDRLVDALQSDARYVAPEFTGVVKRSYTTTGASAYVKVSEGCSNNCSYCLIPSLRGGLVSKPPRDIIDECRDLAASGVKEIILVAQDLGGYGRDHEGYPHLSSLLKDISRIEDIQWIRLMYMHPASLDEPLVTAMRDNPKVVPYLDLPIQHVSETVLKAMGRRGGADAVRKALRLLDDIYPDIWIRSTVMVGHPGEDEQAFSELEEFILTGRIDHLGVFAYSPEEGTRSASLLGEIPQEVKNARRDRIMEIQQSISRRRLASLVGEKVQVLVEGYHPETDLLLAGRAPFQAPEVDGMVIITEGTPSFGTFSEVEITDTMEYDLLGRIA
ncbi:MAG: 30S ribosomal protein S12 methylthiotransferase RimO [Desulfomonilia bacterium]